MRFRALGTAEVGLGIVLSHPHFDHYGLLAKVPHSIPVYLGEAAARILQEGVIFTSMGISIAPAGFLRHRQSFALGPFHITAYLNNHSAFDAYSLLVEAGGRKVFYTGDIRAHGRKATLFEELVRYPPSDVEVLLMEGTDRKSTRLNSSHIQKSRMPSSA